MKHLALVILCTATLFSRAQIFNITTYGAVGNGTTLNTVAIQAAVDSCHNAGGGIVQVPLGTFLTSTIFLKSNVTIRIDSGGTIMGSGTIADYPEVNTQIRTFADGYPQRSIFYAENQHNIAITGQGTVDGNGTATGFLLDHSHAPLGFRIISCTNVRYEGVTLHNSGFWMMHNFNIDTLVFKNLIIVNQAYGNNDGIDIDGCRGVLVDSCNIDCNDDAIVMKIQSPIETDGVEIKNCTVASYSRGIKIGTETFGPIKNVHVHDCIIQFSTKGPLGIHSPAKGGINIAIVNGGSMENVLFENITMTGIHTPILVRLGNQPKKYTDTAPLSGPGSMHNVELRNITATASSDSTSSITGIPGYDVKDIKLQDIDITYPGGWPALPSYYPVPENESAKPEANLFGDTLPASGLYIRHVDSIQIHNVCFHAIHPDGRPEIFVDDVQNLDTAALCGDLVLGLPESELAPHFNCYPNPANGNYIMLQGNDYIAGSKLDIVSIDGRLIKTMIVRTSWQSIDIKDISRGIYLLRLTKGTTSFTKKLVRQ